MKTGLIIAICLFVIGSLLFVLLMSIKGWDFSSLTTVQYVENMHTVNESVRDIQIHVRTADVVLAKSQDGECRVVCHENQKEIHSVYVSDGVLVIENNSQTKWYERIGIGAWNTKITVYLPQTAYESVSILGLTSDVEIGAGFQFASLSVDITTGDVDILGAELGSLEIKRTTGDAKLNSVTCGDMTVSGTTGDATITDLTCENLSYSGTTGDVVFTRVIASGKLLVALGSGDVSFERLDASEIAVTVTTGDVEGSLLSGKTFTVNTTTGDVSYPQGASGGPCTVKTTTGDVIITIEQ